MNCGICWKMVNPPGTSEWHVAEVEWSREHVAQVHGFLATQDVDWVSCESCIRKFPSLLFGDKRASQVQGRFIVVGWDSAGWQPGWCYDCALWACADRSRLLAIEKAVRELPGAIDDRPESPAVSLDVDRKTWKRLREAMERTTVLP